MINNNNEVLYEYTIILGKNYDSSIKQNISLGDIFNDNTINTNYIKMYKIQTVSSCTGEYKFNFTVDNEIDVSEKEIKLQFNPISSGNRKRNFTVEAQCTLSSKNKKLIPCQMLVEVSNWGFTLSDFIEVNEDELIVLTLENKDTTFSFQCSDETPIIAIIFLVVVFFFVVIVVIIIIIVMNKKGRGERGYELPNESNNMIGISGNASK